MFQISNTLQYDEGQIASVLAEAYQMTKNEHYATTLKEVLNYVERDMTFKEGDMLAFFSAEDADSLRTRDAPEKTEGAFYVWDYHEVTNILDQHIPEVEGHKASSFFNYMFDVRPNGNVDYQSDPRGELSGLNVLAQRREIHELHKRFNISEQTIEQVIAQCKQILFEERNKRPRPHLDDKIITSWNGYVIDALSKASIVLSDRRYADVAERAAQFIFTNLYNDNEKTLNRSYRKGSMKASVVGGFLEDYANMTSALISLYQATGRYKWLNWAFDLFDTQVKLFLDQEHGGFFEENGQDPTILYRLKEVGGM